VSPRLPTPLLQALQRRQSRFLGRKLRADIRLRSVYLKLGVSDKGALAGRMQ
jgi:hypothetical protein